MTNETPLNTLNMAQLQSIYTQTVGPECAKYYPFELDLSGAFASIKLGFGWHTLAATNPTVGDLVRELNLWLDADAD